MKIVSLDWLTLQRLAIPSCQPAKCPLAKRPPFLNTGSTGSHCCFQWYFTKLGFVRYNKINMPCQCGYPDGMSLLWRMVFPRAPPSGKTVLPLGDIFHQDTHTGMAYLYNVLKACIKTFSTEHPCALNIHGPFHSLTGPYIICPESRVLARI